MSDDFVEEWKISLSVRHCVTVDTKKMLLHMNHKINWTSDILLKLILFSKQEECIRKGTQNIRNTFKVFYSFLTLKKEKKIQIKENTNNNNYYFSYIRKLLAFYKKKEDKKKIINEKKKNTWSKKEIYIYILYRYFDRLYYITGLKNYYVCGNIMNNSSTTQKTTKKYIKIYLTHNCKWANHFPKHLRSLVFPCISPAKNEQNTANIIASYNIIFWLTVCTYAHERNNSLLSIN